MKIAIFAMNQTNGISMKAMVFAAGLGSRLSPLTDNKPKALVRINDKTMLQYQLEKLEASGFSEVIVNTHHFSDQVIAFLQDYNAPHLKIIISDESDLLLETGGAILKAYPFFQNEEAILLHNVDVFSELDLDEFYQEHLNSGALATLAVRQRNTSRYLLFNDDGILCGWENRQTGEQRISREAERYHAYAFSGIHCIHPKLAELTKHKGKCSVIDIYLELAKTHDIKAFIHNDGLWVDAGKPRQVRQLAQIL